MFKLLLTCNQYKNINEMFYFFTLNLQYLVCILHLQHISTLTSYISSWLVAAVIGQYDFRP